MMKCEEVARLLSLYLDGEVSEAERAGIEGHLDSCEKCRSEVETLRKTIALVKSLPPVKAPADFTAGVMKGISLEPAEVRHASFWITSAKILFPVAAAAAVLFVVALNLNRQGAPELAKQPAVAERRLAEKPAEELRELARVDKLEYVTGKGAVKTAPARRKADEKSFRHLAKAPRAVPKAAVPRTAEKLSRDEGNALAKAAKPAPPAKPAPAAPARFGKAADADMMAAAKLAKAKKSRTQLLPEQAVVGGIAEKKRAELETRRTRQQVVVEQLETPAIELKAAGAGGREAPARLAAEAKPAGRPAARAKTSLAKPAKGPPPAGEMELALTSRDLAGGLVLLKSELTRLGGRIVSEESDEGSGARRIVVELPRSNRDALLRRIDKLVKAGEFSRAETLDRSRVARGVIMQRAAPPEENIRILITLRGKSFKSMPTTAPTRPTENKSVP